MPVLADLLGVSDSQTRRALVCRGHTPVANLNSPPFLSIATPTQKISSDSRLANAGAASQTEMMSAAGCEM